MQTLTDIINTIGSYIGMVLIVPLVGTGIYLTLRMRFVQIRKLKHSWEIIRGVYDDPEDAGDITHFQALSAALSATIGIGNIAGVATAIHYGGPGALFWMWVTAFFGMCTKYVECTLSQKYRKINPDGSASGGPMYYIEKGLGTGWKPLAVIFAFCAVLCSFGTGNMVQSFTVADSFRTEFGIPTWVTGLAIASLVALVIIGGIKRIGLVASKLVPFMSALYIIAALTILGMYFSEIPVAFGRIMEGAFTPLAGLGGFAGATMLYTLNWGVKRGLFSNEAGQGSAPIAHAAAKTGEPIREGAVAMVGPLLDTLIICTMTGLVILVTGAWTGKQMTNKPLTDVEFLQPGSEYTTNTKLDGEEFVGEFVVNYGKPEEVSLAANHGIIDGALIGYTEDEPFNGKLVVDDDGNIAVVDSEVKTGDLLVYGMMRQNGSLLTSFAFSIGLGGGPWGSWLVTIGVFLFAISTMISWSYYGDRSVQYLWGDKAVLPYKWVYVCFNFLGSILALEVVWGLGDVALSLMSFPNLLALLILAVKVATWQKDYFSREHRRFR
ncbi:sodium:alanine symporter family protein [candidate division LCP-89 bacterium B3_LCP]|uniref:Sodium:alanine symporter family protein n=1 Tax=candidate division LCP-89 bacterium B3_LCP TaxID=2012998 RepID=A0A532UU28_UNCL8|nr:MAG: sodium:alanine symporter family protein [candidate division LCP-89 bacterium B3_LCP]